MRDKLNRAFLIFIAVIFVVTTLVVSVWGFFEATRQPATDKSLDQSADQDQCTPPAVQGVEKLVEPKAFKPNGDVKKLEVTDIEQGEGDLVKSGDCIVVKYYGTLASNGKLFEENFSTSDAFQTLIGVGQLIPGWDQGLMGMKVGGMRRLVIPSELAYGDQVSQSIPANSDLVFVVKVLDAK